MLFNSLLFFVRSLFQITYVFLWETLLKALISFVQAFVLHFLFITLFFLLLIYISSVSYYFLWQKKNIPFSPSFFFLSLFHEQYFYIYVIKLHFEKYWIIKRIKIILPFWIRKLYDIVLTLHYRSIHPPFYRSKQILF